MGSSLPNFLIVGAAKSGTSSLHNYINQHTDIFMPDVDHAGRSVKEPQFMVKDIIQDRLHFGVWSFKEYKELFNDVQDHKMVGEASVFYLYFYEEAIKNIKMRLGDKVKIIIMLRNPIERAYSAYFHVSRGLKENLSFEEAIGDEESRFQNDSSITPMIRYKDMGLYYQMVKRYLEEFSDVLIILHEDFRDDTQSVLRRVFQFLDVDDKQIIDTNIKYNIGGKQWKNRFLKYMFHSNNVIKKFANFITPSFIKKQLTNKLVNLSKNKVPPMHIKTEQFLKNFYKEDVKNLSKLINRDLHKWIR